MLYAPCRAGLLVAPLAALPSISHVIPQQVVQTLKSPRWNCNVFGRSQKMTVGNYVRLFLGWLSPSLSGAAARPRHRPRAPQPGLPFPPVPSTSVARRVLTCGSARRLVLRPGSPPNGTTARPGHHPVGLASLIAGSTTNFACNSHAIVSNYEFTALELQRFHTLLNLHRVELHAELMEPGPTTASFESGTLRRCRRF